MNYSIDIEQAQLLLNELEDAVKTSRNKAGRPERTIVNPLEREKVFE